MHIINRLEPGRCCELWVRPPELGSPGLGAAVAPGAWHRGLGSGCWFPAWLPSPLGSLTCACAPGLGCPLSKSSPTGAAPEGCEPHTCRPQGRLARRAPQGKMDGLCGQFWGEGALGSLQALGAPPWSPQTRHQTSSVLPPETDLTARPRSGAAGRQQPCWAPPSCPSTPACQPCPRAPWGSPPARPHWPPCFASLLPSASTSGSFSSFLAASPPLPSSAPSIP